MTNEILKAASMNIQF